MPAPLSSLIDPESNLPSKDNFFKTNRIFNDLFKRSIQLKEGPVSKTNINGVIWANFGQVVIRNSVREYEGEYLLSCGHTYAPRSNDDLSKLYEICCHRCGMLAAYRSFEHEWSHIIFKSSPALFDRFVQDFSNHYGSYELVELVALVIGVFDDIRVNSLWNIVYPGSALEIEKRWIEFNDLSPDINTNFITWLFGVALHSTRVGPGPFHDLVPLADKALRAVHGKGTANMLVVVRWFLEQCIERLMKSGSERQKESEKDEGSKGGESGEDNQTDNSQRTAQSCSREDAAAKLTNNLKDFNRAQEHHLIDKRDYVSKIAYKLSKEEEDAIAQIMRYATKDLKEDIPIFQPQGVRRPIDGDMEDAVRSLQQSHNEEITENQYLLTDTPDKVMIADVLPEHILPGARLDILPEQQADIDRMRAVFARFIGKKIARLVEDGDEIDIQALIQYRLDGQDNAVFEDEGLTKGFAYLTLCDMSHSMEGAPFNYVCLGSEMLKKALNYPFVKGHLWGFRGAIGEGSVNYTIAQQKVLAATKGGEVWIYKYHPDCDGYLASEVEAHSVSRRETIPVKCGGTTPTHISIHLATKYILSHVSSGMDKKIFLLTDGNPTQFKTNGSDVPKEALMKMVRDEVVSARSKGVQIYSTILGNEITDKDALEMFGPQAFWKRVPADMVGQALLEMVVTQFVRFLKG